MHVFYAQDSYNFVHNFICINWSFNYVIQRYELNTKCSLQTCVFVNLVPSWGCFGRLQNLYEVEPGQRKHWTFPSCPLLPGCGGYVTSCLTLLPPPSLTWQTISLKVYFKINPSSQFYLLRYWSYRLKSNQEIKHHTL